MLRVTSIFSLVCLSFSVFAQETERAITFSEAVKIALENNITLKQQANQQYVNQAQKNSSLARVAPNVSAFAQGWQVQGNQFIEQEARVVNDAQTANFYGTLDASMLLFNGFNRMNSIRMSNSDLDAQQHLVNRTRQDVITNVSNQYLQCLLDQELLQIASEDVKNQQNQLNQITEMVNSGARAKVDQFNQEAQVKSAELVLLRAEIRLRRDKTLLAQTLLLDPATVLKLEQPAWGIEPNDLDVSSLDNLYSTALESRGDYLRAQKNVESTKRGLSISKTSFMPSLSAYASINSRYSDASIPAFSDQINDNQRKEFGLRLNIPIFNGMQNNVTFVRSRVNYNNAQLNLENAEITVKADVLNAHQNYKDATLNYEASKAQLDAAKLSFDLEQERYQLGVSDFVSFSQANQTYIRAKGDFAQASYTLLFQDILLQYATGTLNEEDIP